MRESGLVLSCREREREIKRKKERNKERNRERGDKEVRGMETIVGMK